MSNQKVVELKQAESVHAIYGQSEPVHLFYTRCGAATASALAIRKGWLQSEFNGPDTALDSLRDSPDMEIRNSHYHHKQTGMFREGGNIPPIWAKGLGQDTVVIGITWIDEYQGILVKSDSHIFDVSDLKGKRAAVPVRPDSVIDFQKGAAERGISTALSLYGLSKTDVKWVNLEAPSYDSRYLRVNNIAERKLAELEALDRGEVDAIFVRFSRGYRISKTKGYREIINLGNHPDPLIRVNNGTPRPITVDREFLEKHPDVVVRYLAVLIKIGDWAAKNPSEVESLLMEEGGSLDVEELRASHGSLLHLSFSPELNDRYIDGLEIQKNFLRDWGYLKKDFNIQDWIVREPLEQARKLVANQNTGKFLSSAAA